MDPRKIYLSTWSSWKRILVQVVKVAVLQGRLSWDSTKGVVLKSSLLQKDQPQKNQTPIVKTLSI